MCDANTVVHDSIVAAIKLTASLLIVAITAYLHIVKLFIEPLKTKVAFVTIVRAGRTPTNQEVLISLPYIAKVHH